jgi:hypothetical protein
MLIAAVAALVLTGCTSTVNAKPLSTHSQSPAPSPAAAVSSPFACSDLAAQADLDAIAPGLVAVPAGEYWIAPPAADPWSASRVSLSQAVYPPSSPTVVAAFERGFFGCYWANYGTQTSLEISALPDAVVGYNEYVRDNAGDYDLRVYDSLGVATTSTGGCGSASIDGPFCRIDALFGTTWLAVRAPVPTEAAGSDAIRAALVDIATDTAAKIGSAKSLVSARPHIASRWDDITDCTSISSAVGSAQPGLGVLARRGLDLTDAYDPIARAAVMSAHGFSCGGKGSAASLGVSVLPGADWLSPLVYTDAATVPTDFGVAKGLVAPRTLCLNAEPGTCWAEGYVDHALVVVFGLRSAAADAKALVSITVALG